MTDFRYTCAGKNREIIGVPGLDVPRGFDLVGAKDCDSGARGLTAGRRAQRAVQPGSLYERLEHEGEPCLSRQAVMKIGA